MIKWKRRIQPTFWEDLLAIEKKVKAYCIKENQQKSLLLELKSNTQVAWIHCLKAIDLRKENWLNCVVEIHMNLLQTLSV